MFAIGDPLIRNFIRTQTNTTKTSKFQKNVEEPVSSPTILKKGAHLPC